LAIWWLEYSMSGWVYNLFMSFIELLIYTTFIGNLGIFIGLNIYTPIALSILDAQKIGEIWGIFFIIGISFIMSIFPVLLFTTGFYLLYKYWHPKWIKPGVIFANLLIFAVLGYYAAWLIFDVSLDIIE
jgi:hypothetical protein